MLSDRPPACSVTSCDLLPGSGWLGKPEEECSMPFPLSLFSPCLLRLETHEAYLPLCFMSCPPIASAHRTWMMDGHVNLSNDRRVKHDLKEAPPCWVMDVHVLQRGKKPNVANGKLQTLVSGRPCETASPFESIKQIYERSEHVLT